MQDFARALTAALALAAVVALSVAGVAQAAETSGATGQRSERPISVAPPTSLAYVPGQVLVRFRDGILPAGLGRLAAAAGLHKKLGDFGSVGGKTLQLFQLEAGASVEGALRRLKSSADVLVAEPNYIRSSTALPNDPSFAKQWGLLNTGQTVEGVVGLVDADIDGEVAWAASDGAFSDPVTVAVVDTGIDLNHPDLSSRLWSNPDEIAGNGVDDDGNGYVDDVNGYNIAGISQTWFNAMWNLGSTGTEWWGQSITGTGQRLSEVGLWLGRVGSPTADIEIVVRETLDGADLATARIPAASVGGTAGPVTATLNAPLTLAVKTYFILFRATASHASNYYTINGNTNTLADYLQDPYREGKQYWWTGTAWTSTPAGDWYFTTNANANPRDDRGHGTHVSGIIAAEADNGVGIAGVSPGARIMVVKAGDSAGYFTTADIIEALRYAADNGARVINMSFGGKQTSSLEQAAVSYARGKGAVLFASAGNDGDATFRFPASYAGVISVAATTNLDTRASFSNANATVDISAPGQDIYSTMPTYPVGLNSFGVTEDYAYLSGTSMAAPMAAGLASLVLSRNPELTGQEVEQLIQNQLVDDKGTSGWDKEFGTGRITAITFANSVSVGNNRISGGVWVSPSPFTGSLDSAGDRKDVFGVYVGAGQRLKLSMAGAGGSDFDFFLYPPGTTDDAVRAGTAIPVVSSAGSSYPESATYLAPAGAGGTYYLWLAAKSGRGDYTVTYSVKDADEDIPGVPVPPSPVTGDLHWYLDENDVYRIDLAEGQQIIATLTGAEHTAFDLYLYGPEAGDIEANPVARSVGADYPERIKFVVPLGGAGTYYLRAAYTTGFDGAYTLDYAVGAADLTPPTTVVVLSPADPGTGSDWYHSPPTLSLQTDEPAATYVQWNGTSDTWWSPYSGPLTAYEGANTLYYYSVDESGNVETFKSRLVKTDTAPPSAPVLSVRADSATSVVLSWSASSDATSGIWRYGVYDADSGALVGTTPSLSLQVTGLTSGTQKRYYVTAFDVAGWESGVSNTVQIATVAAGNSIEATVESVTVVFSSVTSPGGFSVVTSPESPASQSGFQVNGVYYEVSTTATYAGPITVTLPYDPATTADPLALRLYHYDAVLRTWVDVTTGVDTTNHTVSGVVTSFSWFGTGRPTQVFGGFDTPLSSADVRRFKIGQTVPVKFRLTDATGAPITTAVARAYVAQVSGGLVGAERPAPSSPPKVGDRFRYDALDGYVFNLDTKRLAAGSWQVRVLLDDGLSYVTRLDLY